MGYGQLWRKLPRLSMCAVESKKRGTPKRHSLGAIPCNMLRQRRGGCAALARDTCANVCKLYAFCQRIGGTPALGFIDFPIAGPGGVGVLAGSCCATSAGIALQCLRPTPRPLHCRRASLRHLQNIAVHVRKTPRPVFHQLRGKLAPPCLGIYAAG